MFDAAVQHVRALQAADKRVLVGVWSEGSRERLCHVLNDHGLTQTKSVNRLGDALALPKTEIPVAVWGLEAGFEAGDLAVLSEQDILGDRLVRPKRKSKRPQDFLTEVAALTPGDLVVHVDHGIGRFEGLQTIEAAGAPHDCLELQLCRRRPAVPAGREHRAPDALRIGRGRGAARPARRRRLAGAQVAHEEAHPRDGRRADEDRRRAHPEGGAAPRPAGRPLRRVRGPLPLRGDGGPAERHRRRDGRPQRPGGRWTASSAAMSASARPRWRCGPPSPPPWRASRSPIVVPTTLLARQHFRTFADRFKGLPLNIAQASRFVPSGRDEEGQGRARRRQRRHRRRHARAPRQSPSASRISA